MDVDKTGLISFEDWCHFLILFPQKNLEYMMSQWKLYSLTSMDPQQPTPAFMEKDIHYKKGQMTTSTFDLIKIFVCGGISGCLSRTVTAPLDRLKVFYQTMYTYSKPPTVWKGLKETYHQHGFMNLFRGNSLSIFTSMLEQALRFLIIEYSKRHFQDEFGHIDSHYFLLIGVITGILSTIVLFPLDVVRIRYISSGDTTTKVPAKIKKIYRNYGVLGFYSGFIPHLISVLPAGSANVFFYNTLKKIFISSNDRENPKVMKFMLLGGSAAFLTSTLTYPLTLLTSRIIVANRDVKIYAERIGFFRMSWNTYKNEGVLGFFKGYSASMLRLFIGQSINFGTYETLRNRFVGDIQKK